MQSARMKFRYRHEDIRRYDSIQIKLKFTHREFDFIQNGELASLFAQFNEELELRGRIGYGLGKRVVLICREKIILM